MKLRKTPHLSSWLALAAVLFFLAGCIPKRVVWSPDGGHAAVLGDQGLYLCDAEGKLSDLLVPDAVLAEWFSDSRRLAIFRFKKYKSWAEVQSMLPTDVRGRVLQNGQIALGELKAGNDVNAALAAVKDLSPDEKTLVGIYLKGIDGMKEMAGANWSFLDGMEAEVAYLQVGTLNEGKITLGPVLATGIQKVFDLRIAPGETAIAYTTDAPDEHEYKLKVVSLDGSKPPQLVAEHAAAYPDWTADGRSLVYFQGVGAPVSGDQLRLGSLTRRGLLAETGKIEIQEHPDELAGLLFYEFGKVRCLKDGRIIFSAMEVHLPSTGPDMPQRQQLFALDPNRQSTLTRLIPHNAENKISENLSFFEVSPDQKRISIAGEKSAVMVLTLATGQVDDVQPPTNDDLTSVPVWRSSDELCFVSFPKTNEIARLPQVGLWANGNTRLLSTSWPAEVRKGLLDK